MVFYMVTILSMSNLSSVKSNNAGVMTLKPKVSKDNIELHFATNHLGHFLLTNLLLDTMKNTAFESNKEGRIINVSSLAHKFMLSQLQETGFNEATFGQFHRALCYGRSKLGNILHSNELARRLKEQFKQILCVTRGFQSSFTRKAFWRVF
uniref:Short-chain dehydrogenase TIC 32ic-like n=1 Tax=Rhizophora mucronata TaxID=61149 RepID=A0A2P2K9G4_RHIMU